MAKSKKKVMKSSPKKDESKAFMAKVEEAGLSRRIDWKSLLERFGPKAAEYILLLLKGFLEKPVEPLFGKGSEEADTCCALAALSAVQSSLQGDHEECMHALMEALCHCCSCCHEVEESDESE